MSDLALTYKWVRADLWMSYSTDSFICEWEQTCLYVTLPFICGSAFVDECLHRLIYMWVRSDLFVCHRLIHMWVRVRWWVPSQAHFHRKSSLYLPLGSVNLVLKLMGTPDGISTLNGSNCVSRWWCWVSSYICILSWLKLHGKYWLLFLWIYMWVRTGSFTCLRLIHMWVRIRGWVPSQTHLHVSNDRFIYMSQTHSYVSEDLWME